MADNQTFNERPVRNLVMELLSVKDPRGKLANTELWEKDLIREIIKYQKSTIERAREFFKTMLDLGLEVCKEPGTSPYSLAKFAFMRGYITKELKESITKRSK